jgi:lipopolysaccharide biosynthesis protein
MEGLNETQIYNESYEKMVQDHEKLMSVILTMFWNKVRHMRIFLEKEKPQKCMFLGIE